MASQTGYQEIARRYALALFAMAMEQKSLEPLAKDLVTLQALIAQSADFQDFMTNTTLKRGDQVRALEALVAHLKVSDLSGKFLGTLASKRRLALLPAIIESVQAEIARHNNEVTAHVTAAEELTAAQVESIASNLKKTLGMDVKINVHTDPAILGGLIIKVGSQLIDSSVQTKLARLARALKSPSSSSNNAKMREVA